MVKATSYLLALLYWTLFVMCIRAYGARLGRRSLLLVVHGCFLYVTPKIGWFLFGFVTSFLHLTVSTPSKEFYFYSNSFSGLSLAIFMILALAAFIKERRQDTSPPPPILEPEA